MLFNGVAVLLAHAVTTKHTGRTGLFGCGTDTAVYAHGCDCRRIGSHDGQTYPLYGLCAKHFDDSLIGGRPIAHAYRVGV